MYGMGLGTEVAVLNFEIVPVTHVVLKVVFPCVYSAWCWCIRLLNPRKVVTQYDAYLFAETCLLQQMKIKSGK